MQWEPSLDRHTLGRPNLERDSLLIKNTAECWAVTAKFCYSGLCGVCLVLSGSQSLRKRAATLSVPCQGRKGIQTMARKELEAVNKYPVGSGAGPPPKTLDMAAACDRP